MKFLYKGQLIEGNPLSLQYVHDPLVRPIGWYIRIGIDVVEQSFPLSEISIISDDPDPYLTYITFEEQNEQEKQST